MKHLKNIILAFTIALVIGLLRYYEIFTPHSATGRPMSLSNMNELIFFVITLGTILFLIFSGFIKLYKKKEEEQKVEEFRRK